ncbi:hypothetical protein [Catellatospora sp. IY07-71]|uniref:hypothetical protein n=1 Tax=Catellatospora sp. IY07-71 TaxID=2728827 RepID=UPI001BB38CE2|nr:hypothetical protein [Catellatospora sp. IY07-71]
MSHTSFLGIPVEGRITPGDRVPQRPLSELQPLVRALVDDDAVVEFGWKQYTPYFNDGEACVFDAWGFWVRTTADDADAGVEDLGVGEYDEPHPTLGGPWLDRGQYPYTEHPYEGDDPERYGRARALADAVGSGAFDDVLLEAFGDHATVRVRRTGITVEFYDHD